jgi:hypothetical protein
MTAADIKPGTIGFVQIRHDPWCRAQRTQLASDCVCHAEVVVVDQRTFLAGIDQCNRKQRRAAERQARKAGKASGGGR